MQFQERVRKALERVRNFLARDAQRLLQDQMAGLLRATASTRAAPCVLVRQRGRVRVSQYPIFSDLPAPRRLELLRSRVFPLGAVAQIYRPA